MRWIINSQRKVEIRNLEGIEFNQDELMTLRTEEDVFEEMKRIYAQYFLTKPEHVTLHENAKRELITAWQEAKRIIQ